MTISAPMDLAMRIDAAAPEVSGRSSLRPSFFSILELLLAEYVFFSNLSLANHYCSFSSRYTYTGSTCIENEFQV